MHAALVLVTQQASCQAEKMVVFFVTVKTVLFLRLLALLSMQHIIILQPQLIMAVTQHIIIFHRISAFTSSVGLHNSLSENSHSMGIPAVLQAQVRIRMFGIRVNTGQKMILPLVMRKAQVIIIVGTLHNQRARIHIQLVFPIQAVILPIIIYNLTYLAMSGVELPNLLSENLQHILIQVVLQVLH